MERWDRTDIWHELEKKTGTDASAAEARKMLAHEMPRIELVLDKGGTSELDFTLHDGDHGYRVAQRMAEIVPADVFPQLSVYELTLLLLSAYLHDIGMTPERSRVSSHFRHLLTGEPCGVSKQDAERFLAWLDNDGRGVEPPLCKGQPSNADLQLAQELITYYARDQHNDWSEEWIRKNLAERPLGTYPHWIDDLVDLCKSHHYGYNQLVRPRFDAKQVGTPSQTVHLRYLAVVLRVADVLEFDPERTPDVIFRHRAIAQKSVIYWHKDHQISIRHERDAKRLVIFASPGDARIHRAVETTVDQVDEELRMCRRLADETHFNRCPGLTEPLPHRWDLPSLVHREIRPKDGAYEYIDGSFRPDTNKVLSLLGGTALYSNPYAGVRELVMNAFDAVSEQIAYERLDEANPANPELEAEIGNRHQVTLRVEGEGTAEVSLVCSDTGAGMSKRIVRDHFLVSGMARRHDILALGRKCRGAGFEMGRVGQFGIGALSYFMLAKRVTLRTRRSQFAGEGEEAGWYFETDGIGSFGELRRDTHKRGTEVRLLLRESAGQGLGFDITKWLTGLRKYLRETIRFAPCKMDFFAGHGIDAWTVRHGWTMDLQWLGDLIIDELRPTSHGLPAGSLAPQDLIPTRVREASEAAVRNYESTWSTLRAELRSALRLHELQGSLPDALGRYRLVIPYFALPDGRSMAFVRPKQAGGETALETIDADHGCLVSPISGTQRHITVLRPTGQPWESWKGFSVDARGFTHGAPPFRKGVLIQIDWTSQNAGSVGANRDTMRGGPKTEDARRWLLKHATAEFLDLCLKFENSPYFSLGVMSSEAPLPGQPRWRPGSWFLPGEEAFGHETRWGQQSYPCALPILHRPTGTNRRGRIEYQGSTVPLVIEPWTPWSRFWGSETVPPDRLVHLISGPYCAAFLWDERPRLETRAVLSAAFPPEWRSLACIGHLGYATGGSAPTHIWNDAHPLVQAVDQASLEWVAAVPEDWSEDGSRRSLVFDPRPGRRALLASRSKAAAWLIRCLEFGVSDIWNGLVERDPAFLQDVWRLIFGHDASSNSGVWQPILGFGLHHHYMHNQDGAGLVSITPEAWISDRKAQGLEGVLPEPAKEWTADWVQT